jgi:hypothetical protein
MYRLSSVHPVAAGCAQVLALDVLDERDAERGRVRGTCIGILNALFGR